MLRNCDWLGLGPMSVGKWSTKDSWGAVTNRRRGAAEPLWTSRDILQQGGLSIRALRTVEEATAVTSSHSAGNASPGDKEGVGAVTQCSGRLQ